MLSWLAQWIGSERIQVRTRALRGLVLALPLVVAIGSAAAGDWSRYLNVRFEYGVDIPPGFSPLREAENSDGGTSESGPGNTTLSVWGAYLTDDPFSAEIRSRIESDASEGWSVGYRALTAQQASWSGTRGDRIRYTRAIMQCGDRTAYAQIEYDASAKSVFDPIVTRLARSLKGLATCRGHA